MPFMQAALQASTAPAAMPMPKLSLTAPVTMPTLPTPSPSRAPPITFARPSTAPELRLSRPPAQWIGPPPGIWRSPEPPGLWRCSQPPSPVPSRRLPSLPLPLVPPPMPPPPTMPAPIIVKAPSTPRMPQTRHPKEATWNQFGHLPPPEPPHPPSSGKRPFSVFPVQQGRPEQRPSEPKEDEQTEDWGVWKAPAQHEDAKHRDEPQPIRLRSRKRSLTRTPSATRPVKAAKRWPEECTRYDLPEARERLVREEARMAAKLLRDKDPWPAESLVYRDKLSHLEKRQARCLRQLWCPTCVRC